MSQRILLSYAPLNPHKNNTIMLNFDQFYKNILKNVFYIVISQILNFVHNIILSYKIELTKMTEFDMLNF